MFVMRKTSRAKWEKLPEFAEGEIPADAVTSDLRTKQNSLLFWRCGRGGTADVEDVALAVAAADRIDKVEVAWLAAERLLEDRQTFESCPGRTPAADLADGHVDLRRLDIVRLGQLASRVAEVLGEGRYQRLTKARVKSPLMNTVLQNRIDSKQLSQNIRRDLAS